jgi:hypothetical protein
MQGNLPLPRVVSEARRPRTQPGAVSAIATAMNEYRKSRRDTSTDGDAGPPETMVGQTGEHKDRGDVAVDGGGPSPWDARPFRATRFGDLSIGTRKAPNVGLPAASRAADLPSGSYQGRHSFVPGGTDSVSCSCPHPGTAGLLSFALRAGLAQRWRISATFFISEQHTGVEKRLL